MSERTLATFADLKAASYKFELESPTGDLVLVEVTAPTKAQLIKMRRELPPQPEAPVTEFRKDADGNPQPVRDTRDAAYLDALDEWMTNYQLRFIARLWKTDIPGDTEDEQIEALADLPGWVLGGVWRAVELVAGIGGGSEPRPFSG